MRTKNVIGRMSLMALPFILLTTGCNDDKTSAPIEGGNELVELQVSPGVATLTRSAIQGGASPEGGSNTDATKLNSIAVYAQSTTTNTMAKSNNYALYARANNVTTWAASGSDKIYLSAEMATVYAYHPAYQPDATTKAFKTSGTALKLTADASATSTIDISVYEGGASGDDANCTIAAIANDDNTTATKDAIASAPGEVDYMWSDGTVEVANGKGTSAKPSSATLTMKHALSMVSFRVYHDGTYKHAGALTKVKLLNESGTILSKGTAPKMKIADGTVTPGAAVAGTFTRIITGYTVGGTTAATAKKLSLLVLPETTATSKATVKAVFTIDGVDYDVVIGGSSTWLQGNNYLYTVKLSGTVLTITNVTVTPWSPQTGGDLNIQ